MSEWNMYDHMYDALSEGKHNNRLIPKANCRSAVPFCFQPDPGTHNALFRRYKPRIALFSLILGSDYYGSP